MSNEQAPVVDLPEGAFQGRESFRALIRQALAEAARAGWRELVISDASFADWPLGEAEVVAALTAWSHRGQRLIMLAKEYDELQRLHPRFVQWRRLWAHKIECRRCKEADPQDLPSALCSPVWAMQRFDYILCNGASGAEPDRRVLLRESIESWIKRSTAGFPATVLGL